MKFLKLGRSRFEFWMLIWVGFAGLLRLLLISFNWPSTNSDEGNMGLLALHVALQGEHPIFFYGSNYLGPLEGYLAAPLFRFFGSSLFSLRLPLVLFFVVFLVGMYYLVRLLYTSQEFALVTVILLGLGSPDVLFLQLRASGEYPELEMFAVLICLLGIWLALTAYKTGQQMQRGERWKRVGVYGLLGLLAGLALWVDLLAAPFVLATGLLLCFFCRHELARLPGLNLLLGFIVGASPLLYYNLTAPWSQNTLLGVLTLSNSARVQMLAEHMTWLNQTTGTLVVALPMATSGAWGCPLNSIPPFGFPTAATLPCVVFQAGWGLGYLILWLSAASLTIFALLRLYRRRYASHLSENFLGLEERQKAIRQYGRLIILAGVGMTLLLYASSPDPAVASTTTFRYLTCLLLALPVLLWPIWKSLRTRKFSVRWWLQATLLLLVAGTLASGMVRTFLQIPSAQVYYQQQETVVQDLLNIHATRFYSDYWTCNVLIFLSKEKLICSTVDDNVRVIPNRYPGYAPLVRAAPHPAYVFVAGTPPAAVMSQRASTTPSHYRTYRFAQYVVFVRIT